MVSIDAIGVGVGRFGNGEKNQRAVVTAVSHAGLSTVVASYRVPLRSKRNPKHGSGRRMLHCCTVVLLLLYRFLCAIVFVIESTWLPSPVFSGKLSAVYVRAYVFFLQRASKRLIVSISRPEPRLPPPLRRRHFALCSCSSHSSPVPDGTSFWRSALRSEFPALRASLPRWSL